MPHLFRVLVPVSDIDAAAAFYGQVLGAAGKRVSPGRHYFDCGGTILACVDPRADGDDYSAQPIPEPVYLSVADIEATLNVCRQAGASFSSDETTDIGPLATIADRPWGERSFYVHDPFGNPLCFVQQGTEFTG